MLCWSLSLVAVFDLPFHDHVHELNAGEKHAGAAEVLEAEPRSGSTLDCAVALLHDVVQVLDLAHGGPLASSGIHGVESRHIRAALTLDVWSQR